MPRTAVVIGGTRRIGRWVSEALLAAGHRVHAVYRSDDAAAEGFAREMAGAGHSVPIYRADMLDEQQARTLMSRVAEAAGGFDTLIYCPGMAQSGAIIGASGEELTALWQSNVLGAHHAVVAAAPYLRLAGQGGAEDAASDTPGGRIVLFLSAGVDSAKAFRDVPLYAASKAMLLSYARSLARELAPARITVNAVALGVTELTPEGAPVVDIERLPTGRRVSQEDLAAALWYLLGPSSDQVTGTVVNLAGGFGL